MIAPTCHALKPGLSELQDIKKEKNPSQIAPLQFVIQRQETEN